MSGVSFSIGIQLELLHIVLKIKIIFKKLKICFFIGENKTKITIKIYRFSETFYLQYGINTFENTEYIIIGIAIFFIFYNLYKNKNIFENYSKRILI